jgi:hypothetical protein
MSSSNMLNVVNVRFSPGYYTCMEDCGEKAVIVRCDRGNVKTPCRVSVDYITEDVTAKAKADYVPVHGRLVFEPNENTHEIKIEIIDNEIFEEDSEFVVRLSNIRVTVVSPSAENGDVSLVYAHDHASQHDSG